MKVEYDHWYKCRKGQMPEDFEGTEKEDGKSYVVVVLHLVPFYEKGRRGFKTVRRYYHPEVRDLRNHKWQSGGIYVSWLMSRPNEVEENQSETIIVEEKEKSLRERIIQFVMRIFHGSSSDK